MPDLGKYAIEVVSAYLVVIVAILGLVVQTVRRSKRVRKLLEAAEGRTGHG